MEFLIQEYGTFGLCLIIIFQIFNLMTRILKMEMKIDNYGKRIEKLERKVKNED